MNLPTPYCPGPFSRRRFLKIGTLALSGVGLGGLLPLRLEAQETGKAPDTSVILLWLPGGPPHMETYDMKPNAPAEYRGEFMPISTNIPGIDISEHLPLSARQMDKFSILRSVTHGDAGHESASHYLLTG